MWFMKTTVYYFLLKKVVPFVRFSLWYPKINGRQYHKLYSILEAGDIIVTVDKKKLTALLVPGEFSHAAMCVSKDGSWELSEMTHTNYTKSCFFDLCKTSDRVVVLGVKNATEQEKIDAVKKCKGLEWARYDRFFLLGIETLYCSELCVVSWNNEKIKADLSDFANLGQPYISPTDLYEADGLYVKADSKNL